MNTNQLCRDMKRTWSSALVLATWIAASSHAGVTDRLEVYLNFDNNLDGQLGTTINGSVTPLTRSPRFVEGMFLEAASFMNRDDPNAVTDWMVSLGRLDSIYTNSFSVGFWVRTGYRSTPQTHGWTYHGALTGNWDWQNGPGWLVSTHFERNLAFESSQQRNVAIPGLTDSNWHHLVAVFDRESNLVYVYLDGLLVHSAHEIGLAGQARLQNTFRTMIGGSGSGALSGSADIDDYAIWSRALSSAEVSQVHGAGLRGLSLAEAEQPGIIFVQTTPSPNAAFVAPTTTIAVTVHSDTDPIDSDSIKMYFDELEVIPVISSSGQDVQLDYSPAGVLPGMSRHIVRVLDRKSVV